MVFKSLNVNLRDKNTRRILSIIAVALAIAITLIIVTSYFMIRQASSITDSKDDPLSLNSYHLKANVRVISNKNSNVYEIEEMYVKDESGNEKSKMISTNEDNVRIIYIVTNNSVYIKNEGQKVEYVLSDFSLNNLSALSVSTFISLYNDILNFSEEASELFKIENVNTDDVVRYKITLNGDIEGISKENIFYKYKNIFDAGMAVQKLELVYNKSKEALTQYIVYDKEGKGVIDVNFTEFNVNEEIDEKTFAF